MPSLPLVSSFLDSVKMCFKTRELTLNMSCMWLSHKLYSLKAQDAIRYMNNLQHLSFSAFWYDPLLEITPNPPEGRHLLYLLPPSLMSLRLGGRISPAMFARNKLPSLTTLDLNAYRERNKIGRMGLVTKVAHPNSRIDHLILPTEKATSNICLRFALDQGTYLRTAASKKPFTLFVFHRNPDVRASRVRNIREFIKKYDIQNVVVHGLFE